jgi:hypothetical protein
MMDEHLTADECDEFAEALLQSAAAVPSEEQEKLLSLAEGYRSLAIKKRMMSREIN